jgi:hypothetical protein
VSDGSRDFGSFRASFTYPVCDRTLAGSGRPLTGGTLLTRPTAPLCDTDLYFNLGDHESGDANCLNPTAASNNTAFGAGWSWVNNELGPQDQCAACAPGTSATEAFALGFGGPLGLNTGARGTGANHLQMLVR